MKVYIVSNGEEIFGDNSHRAEENNDTESITLFRTPEAAKQCLKYWSDKYDKVDEIELMHNLRVIELEVKRMASEMTFDEVFSK